jgi:hypothetical protein
MAESHNNEACCTSYGIAYTSMIGDRAVILLGERMTSIGFTCIITGQYSFKNLKYLKKLLGGCSIHEICALIDDNYDSVMCYLDDILKGRDTSMLKLRGCRRFERLLELYPRFFSECIEEMRLQGYRWSEYSEFEPPKGRKKFAGEHGYNAAIREFHEETGVLLDVNLLNKDKEYCIAYRGLNGLTYKTILYSLYDEDCPNKILSGTKPVCFENRRLLWMSPHEFYSVYSCYNSNSVKVYQNYKLFDEICNSCKIECSNEKPEVCVGDGGGFGEGVGELG